MRSLSTRSSPRSGREPSGECPARPAVGPAARGRPPGPRGPPAPGPGAARLGLPSSASAPAAGAGLAPQPSFPRPGAPLWQSRVPSGDGRGGALHLCPKRAVSAKILGGLLGWLGSAAAEGLWSERDVPGSDGGSAQSGCLVFVSCLLVCPVRSTWLRPFCLALLSGFILVLQGSFQSQTPADRQESSTEKSVDGE